MLVRERVRLLPGLPMSILNKGSKEGMQALMRPMLSSRQLQIMEEVRFPVCTAYG